MAGSFAPPPKVLLTGAGTALNSAAATTLSPVVPAAARVGDLLFMTVTVRTGTAQTFTAPAGWTQRLNVNAQSPVLAVFTKTCVAADISAAQAVSWQTSINCAAAVLSFSGVHSTNPILSSASGSNTSGNIQYGTMAWQTNGMVVSVAAAADAVAKSPPTAYGTWTEVVDNATNQSLEMATSPALNLGPATALTGPGPLTTSQGAEFMLRPAPAVSPRTQNTAVAEGASPKAMSSPATTQIGDILLASVSVLNGTPTITAPGGWTLVTDGVWNTNGRHAVYRHKATAAGATSHSFSWTGAGTGKVVVVGFAGVDVTTPVDASGFVANASSTTVTSPSITTTVADTLLVRFTVVNSGAVSAYPAGMNTVYDVGAVALCMLVSQIGLGSAVATTAITHTLSAATTSAGIVVALRRTGAPNVRGNTVNTGDNITSLVVETPVNVAGDLLVAALSSNAVGGTWTPPSGWTEIESQVAASPYTHIYVKDALSSGSEPSTLTFTSSTAERYQVVVASIDGGRAVDVDADNAVVTAATITYPTVTPTVANTLMLMFGHSGNSFGTPVVGGLDYFSDYDLTTTNTYLVSEAHAEATATGTRLTNQEGATSPTHGNTLAIRGRSAPNAPTLVAPSNAAILDLAAAGNIFDWSFAPVDGDDTQSAWAMRRKIGAGAYTYYNVGTGVWDASIVWNTDTLTAYTFAAAKWTNGNTYLWSVATKGDSGLEGPFASDFSVVANSPSVVTVTGPTSPVTTASRPPVTWSFTDSESDTQQTFQVKIESGAYSNIPGSGTLKVDSGEISSAGLRTWTPTVDMVNSTTYRAFVRVKTAGLYSAWAFTTFTMSLTLPAAPTLVTTWQSATNRVNIDVTGTHTTAAFPTTTYRVEYSDDAGVTWATVRGGSSLPGSGTPGPTTQTIYDYEAPSYRTRQYRAFTIAEVA